MLRDLAEYENPAHEVQSKEDLMFVSLFADEPAVWCSILEHSNHDKRDNSDAESPESGGAIAGFGLWFRNFFTWTAKHFLGRPGWTSGEAA